MTFLNSPNSNPGEEGSIIMNPRAKLILVITGLILIAIYQLIVATPFLRGFSYGDSYIPGFLVMGIIFIVGTCFLLSPAAIDEKIKKLEVDWREWVLSACVTMSGIVMITSIILYIITTDAS
jgi:energy-coupling factor transporter transmembrane protein EcfT